MIDVEWTHEAESLGRQGLDWLLAQARATESGLGWPYCADADKEPNQSLYAGGPGIVLALLEGWLHFSDERYADAVLRGSRTIAESVETCDNDSLHFGLAGMGYVLRRVQRLLGDEASGTAADRAFERVGERFDGVRWNEMFELLFGNAGIALGAVASGDVDLAVRAVEPYAATADETDGGVNWPVRPTAPRSHHMAHGTLGIVCALAEVGRAAGRQDLIELALRGAADVVARDEEGPHGFLVPHSDPPHRPDIIERYSYGWCNGPAGDAQAFRLLGAVTGDAEPWDGLVERCWHTVRHSGLPQRLRPGFWDNSGSCCGTAGVLAFACDRIAEAEGEDAKAEAAAFADILVGDLASRATVDESGARWSNYESRDGKGRLTPWTGWAHGNAGIVRELLRYARIGGAGAGAGAGAGGSGGGSDSGSGSGYAVPMPDYVQTTARP